MSLFREISDTFDLFSYLLKIQNRKQRNAITKLRLSLHVLSLFIETGRYTEVTRENRKCILCNKNDLEDEFHFVLICPFYQELRTTYIKRYYTNNPSMYEFLDLLNSKGKYLKNLALFIIKAFEIRNTTINNTVQ